MPSGQTPERPTPSGSDSGSAPDAEETTRTVGGLPAGLVPRMLQLQAQVQDLALLVRRLMRRLEPDDPLLAVARDYLSRKGLQGSPLRDDLEKVLESLDDR